MSIKAKAVEKDRAAAFARGQFVVVSASTTATAAAGVQKRSFYYEEERRYDGENAVTASGSSSSSRSSSCSSSAPPTGALQPHAPPRPVASNNHHYRSNSSSSFADGDDISDDEEVVRRARAATQALLGGGGCRGDTRPASANARPGGAATSVPQSNSRLEAYLRGRTGSVPTLNAAGCSAAAVASITAATSTLQSNYVTSSYPALAESESIATANRGGLNKVAQQLNSESAGATASNTSNSLHEKGSTESTAIEKALQLSTTNTDFQQLMYLFERDVRQEQQRHQAISKTTVASRAAATMPTGVATGEGARAILGVPTVRSQREHTPPPRTFASLEDTALEELFNDWCHRFNSPNTGGTDDNRDAEGDDGDTAVFVAADHRAAAFTLAAVAARDLDASSWGCKADLSGVSTTPYAATTTTTSVINAPLTWEELMQSEVTRRNTRRVVGGVFGGLLSSPSDVAEQATQQLRRFMQSVECIEKLVNNRRFMHSVAVYLYGHHKVFLSHYSQSPTPSPSPAAEASSSVIEHRHEEYVVYEEFGRRVSTALLSLLSSNVEGFDEAEFVEALYDTPAVFSDNDVPGEGGAAALKGPHNVLSFPAWRLVLAMSDFKSFFGWMMDYIYEEYHLDKLEEEKPSVAGSGARGLRALIRSTCKRPTEDAAAAIGEDVSALATSEGKMLPAPGSGSQTSPLISEATQSPIRLAESLPLSLDAPQAVSSSSLKLFPDPSLRPKGTLAPLPSSAVLDPAPLPVRNALSSSFNGCNNTNSCSPGVHLRQFFPSPPASAEGGARATAATATTATMYRKRQTTYPGRNLPPITPSTDAIVRPGSSEFAEGRDRDSNRAITASVTNLSASPPVPLRVSDTNSTPVHVGRNFASTAPSAATNTAGTSVAALAPAHRLTRTRSSAEQKSLSTGLSYDATAARRGSKTLKPKSRTSSTTRSKVGEAPKAKPQKPKLNR